MNYYVLCLVCWILLGITGKISISTSPVTYVSGVRSLDQSIFRDSRGKVCPSTLCPSTRLVDDEVGGRSSRISPCVTLTSSHPRILAVWCLNPSPLSLLFVVRLFFQVFARGKRGKKEEKRGKEGEG